MGLADQPGRAAFGWGAALALLSPYHAGVGRLLLLLSQGSDCFGCFLTCLLVLSLSELERVRGDVDFCGRTQHELSKICSIWYPVISRKNLVSSL